MINNINFIGEAAGSSLATNIVAAIIILLIGFMAGRIIGSLLNKLLIEIQLDRSINRFKKQEFSVSKAISELFSMVIYLLTVYLALEQLGITIFILKSLIGILIVVVSGAIILSAAFFLPNSYYNLFSVRKKIKKGQIIEVDGMKGKVVSTNLMSTIILTETSEKIAFPNIYVARKIRSRKLKVA